MTDVVLPIRLMKLMGAKVLFLTNASGGIRQGFHPGDLMLITGQISSFVPSPLIGENIPELGPRFPDMSHVYDEDLQQIVKMEIQYRLILLIISVSPDPCISIQSQHRLPLRNLIISEFHISFLSCHTACLSLLTQHKGTL